jgi:hypothetical protein
MAIWRIGIINDRQRSRDRHWATQASSAAFSLCFELTANVLYSQDCSILEAPLTVVFGLSTCPAVRMGAIVQVFSGHERVLKYTQKAGKKKPRSIGEVFLRPD